jgi:hypothetical protein
MERNVMRTVTGPIVTLGTAVCLLITAAAFPPRVRAACRSLAQCDAYSNDEVSTIPVALPQGRP